MNNNENDKEEKIIVFESYETTLKANLAKTKLDAYGIPCFLTDENFNSLYPFQNELIPGVRLHIFERDKERVKEILEETAILEPDVLLCPVCGSTQIKENFNEPGLMKELTQSVLTGLFLAPKKEYTCQTCGCNFKAHWD